MRKWSRVEVEWLDAYTDLKQVHDVDYEKYKPVVRKTLGYVIWNDKNRITIAGTDDRESTHFMESNCADITTIPKGMVVSVVQLWEEKTLMRVKSSDADVKNVKEDDPKDYPKGDSEGGPGSTRHPTLKDLLDRMG